MELSSLRAFVAVAENRSFSIAAKKLFLTQPAVSKRIGGLEDQLKVSLFDRSGRTVHLTEAGVTLLKSAKQILKDIEVATDQIRSLGKEVAGRLRIATSHHIGIHRLPPVLRQFTQAYPNVELDLQFMDSEDAANHIRSGSAELAIATLPLNPIAGLDTLAVWHDPLVVVCPHDHPLTQYATISATELGYFPAVLPAIGTITRDIINDFLSDNGIDIRIALETNYLETIKVMVGVGLGWSALPASMLGEDIVALPVEELSLHRTLGVIRMEQRTMSTAASRFIELLVEEK